MRRWLTGLLVGLWAGGAAAGDGTLVIAVPGDPGHLNPAISTASPVHAVADSIFNGLVALDRDLAPVPDLAVRWTASEDGRRYEFTLAPNVRWHDGTPFTAADVKFSFDQILLTHHARTRAGLAPVIDAVEAPDDHTVVFRLKQPHPALLHRLDVTEAPILPRHRYGGGDPNRNPANLAPIGTGPFRFESYRKDDRVVLVRNPDYFKPGLPHLNRLVFRVIPDANTQVLALLQGEVDYLGRVSGADAARLRGRGVGLVDVQAGPGGANCVMTLGFNLDRAPLADRRVREALVRTIDRGQLLERVAFGQGRIAAAPIGSGIGWAHLPGALDGLGVDVQAAARLLDAAGLVRGADGMRATMSIVHFPQFARWSELMRQQLAAVGIGLRIRTLDPAALAQAVFVQRDFDLTLISYCNGTDPEIGVRRMYDSAAIGAVPFSNAAAYRDAAVDDLFARAGTASDLAVRGRLYRHAQRRIADALPYWWLVETDFTAAHRETFTGFAPWSGQFAESARRVQ